MDRHVTGLQQQGLKEIFDEQKVQEQIELGQLAGQVGFRAAGDLAAAMGWQEGSAEKVILHGAVGAAVAALGGGDALQGLTGAAANQLAFNAIREYLTDQDIDPDGPAFALFMQLASLAVGAAAGGESGAGTALAATQNNWLNHREYEEAMQAKAACDQGNAQSCARYEALAQLDQQRDQDFAQYLRDVSLAAHREGKPLDEAFYRDIQKQYWRDHLGWGSEPYYLSDTHRPVYPTTQQEMYRFLAEGPGKYLGANAWIATGAAEWAGDFVAAWKDWLNPGSGQNALTGQTIEGVDAWGKRFVGSVELGTLFIGGGMSSAARGVGNVIPKTSNASLDNIARNIHIGQQGKHILGHNNFIPGRSFFNEGIDPQKLLNGVHSGEFSVVGYGSRGQPIVDFGQNIGVDGSSGMVTRYGTIHSGKNGSHIVPANPSTVGNK